MGAGDSPAHCLVLLCGEMQRKYEYRRYLPHFQKEKRALFITYSTWHRWHLPEAARDLALDSCLRANGRKYNLYAAVAMPDHVHLVWMPLSDENGLISIPEITRTIKSESAHHINKALGRRGRVWQDESFDHILRGDESLRRRIQYISRKSNSSGLSDSSRRISLDLVGSRTRGNGFLKGARASRPSPTRSEYAARVSNLAHENH